LFFQHDHLTYDKEEARAKFETDITTSSSGNVLAFKFNYGEVTHMAPTGLQEALVTTVFETGDQALDRVLETARQKFLNGSLDVRREGSKSSGTPGRV
jgi:hypothetical protein